MDSPSAASGACTWKLALGGAAAVCLGALLAGARPASTAAGRCVGMFMDAPGRSGALPDTIPADATNLAVRGVEAQAPHDARRAAGGGCGGQGGGLGLRRHIGPGSLGRRPG